MDNQDLDYEILLLTQQQIKINQVMSGADPCWDGYEMVGMKKGKNGKMVPNCVPIAKKDDE
ncbi:hypothetical protein EBT25_17680, partial [bacterium]|nr:hypothetical protein [bacterium]